MEVPFSFIRPKIKYNNFQRIDRFRDNRQHIQLLKSITPQSNKKMLITDLKPEYKVVIDKLRVKQQFCTFHLKQLINREIREHIKENNAPNEEIEIIHNYKQLFFNIINAQSINEAQEKRNQLFYLESNIPQVIQDLASKLIIPEFKKKSQIT